MHRSTFLSCRDFDGLASIVAATVRLWLEEPVEVRRYDTESLVYFINHGFRDVDGHRVQVSDPEAFIEALVNYAPYQEGVVDPGDVKFILGQFADIFPARIQAVTAAAA